MPDEHNKARDVFWIKYTYVRNLKVKYKDNPSIIRQLNKYYDDFKHIKIMECFIRDEDKTTQYTIAGLDRGYIALKTIEHKVSPIIVARLNANANDVYGTGEIMLAISLIERANKIKGFIAKQLNSDFLGI
ncbi:MAG: hypothetical protein OEZ01_05170, partial [Candidatus Heimdallarchaeota archaeon]|nr:hypothetical protein [Candidatus Heimdallarchaeota archaeon]